MGSSALSSSTSMALPRRLAHSWASFLAGLIGSSAKAKALDSASADSTPRNGTNTAPSLKPRTPSVRCSTYSAAFWHKVVLPMPGAPVTTVSRCANTCSTTACSSSERPTNTSGQRQSPNIGAGGGLSLRHCPRTALGKMACSWSASGGNSKNLSCSSAAAPHVPSV